MIWLRRAVRAILIVMSLASAAFVAFWHRTPSIDAYPVLNAPVQADSVVQAQFLGVSTLIFTSGDTSIATDMFLSRPPLGPVIFGRVEPDVHTIRRVMAAAGVRRLASIIPVHSHYDHAMDAPAVAALTGAEIIGSRSTQMIAAGTGFQGRVQVARGLSQFQSGPFEIVLVPSIHGPTPELINDRGEIDAPLVPPQRAFAYKEGGCFSVFVSVTRERRKRSILVHSSAGYVAGALKGYAAEVVYLGVTPMGSMTDDERGRYWDEVVRTVGAKRVIAVHWDNFLLPLTAGEDVRPFPVIVHDLNAALDFIVARGKSEGVEVVMPQTWVSHDPFAGL